MGNKLKYSICVSIVLVFFSSLTIPTLLKNPKNDTEVDSNGSVLAESTPAIALPDGQTWQLKFSDEFDGTSLNTSKWEPSWFTGSNISPPINDLEASCYDPQQVSVSGGTLKLTATTTNKPTCKDKSGAVTTYASGLVNTRLSYTFTYGYVEARMYLPGSNGKIWNWPAFWTNGTGNWPKTGEIDVMEGLDNEACWHYHYQDANGKHQGPGGCVTSDKTGWHTFAAYWEADKIRFYYDGVLVGTQTAGIVNAKHFIIFNNGINPDYGINIPATLEVDYVRVWQAVTGTPTPICGNGVKESGETCDDGNTSNNDQCSSNCLNACTSPLRWNGSACITPPVCGNGTKETGEICDDGNTSNNDQCSSNCLNACTSPQKWNGSACITPAVCGNGTKESGEACDDGNTQNGDSCNSTCTSVTVPQPQCGAVDYNFDGIVNEPDMDNFLKLYLTSCIQNTITSGCGPMDYNSDGRINVADFNNFRSKYGKICN